MGAGRFCTGEIMGGNLYDVTLMVGPNKRRTVGLLLIGFLKVMSNTECEETSKRKLNDTPLLY